jgi:hypothetical protein
MHDADELRIARAAETGLHRKQAADAVMKTLAFFFILFLGIGIFAHSWLGFLLAIMSISSAGLFMHKRTNGNL